MDVRTVWTHPKGRFEVREYSGINFMGDPYCYREAVLTPERDQRVTMRQGQDPHRPSRRPLTDEEREKICALYRDGVEMTEIVRRVKRSLDAVRRALELAGLRERRMRVNWTAQEIDKARRMWLDGASSHQIAAQLGRTASGVRQKLNEIKKIDL